MTLSIILITLMTLMICLYFVLIHRYHKYTMKKDIITRWLAYYQSYCDETDVYTLNKQLKNIQHKPDAFDALFKHFKTVFKSVTNTPLTHIDDALYTRLDIFKIGETVYDQIRDVTGHIDGLNDDGTYTVCDVVEQCHRAVEMDLIPMNQPHMPDTLGSV